MSSLLIRHATLINEGQRYQADVLVKNGIIDKIAPEVTAAADQVIDAQGQYLLPGVIDDQVHFREPGLTHKGDLTSESRAAVAGGVTSYMEMPNTSPQTLTQGLLTQKYERAAAVSAANYSFYMGASNDNLSEVLKTDPYRVCGVKVFMGSSTGNMLVDDLKALEGIFRESTLLVATHCEKEEIIRANLAKAQKKFKQKIPIAQHPIIRSTEACYASSSEAVELAHQHGTRLHVLHISTAKELALFDADTPLADKRITAEACIHHLWFTDADYAKKGTHIKWNPAVKAAADRQAIRQAVIDGRIDVIATDHAPHTLAEKDNPYLLAPSGGPMIQHSLVAMLELASQGVFTIEQVVAKMSHDVATCFQVEKRGYLREGYYADLVLVAPQAPWRVNKSNLQYKCGWSPMEGQTFHHQVKTTVVSGQVAYHDGVIDPSVRGMRMTFRR
jgi:dihydroorotase